MSDIVTVERDEAAQRGLPPVSIRVDARSAGMFARKFPDEDVYLKLNGPPGGPLLLMIWNCEQPTDDLASLVRSKLVPAWTSQFELGTQDSAHVLGAVRAGVTFATDEGIARTAWFGFRLDCGPAHLLITIGVGGRDNTPVAASEVLANSAIRKVLETLQIAP